MDQLIDKQVPKPSTQASSSPSQQFELFVEWGTNLGNLHCARHECWFTVEMMARQIDK